jgi:hypothetical protein
LPLFCLKIIVVADMTMSLDNMLGVGAASRGNVFLLIFGLTTSIPIMIVASNLLSMWFLVESASRDFSSQGAHLATDRNTSHQVGAATEVRRKNGMPDPGRAYAAGDRPVSLLPGRLVAMTNCLQAYRHIARDRRAFRPPRDC